MVIQSLMKIGNKFKNSGFALILQNESKSLVIKSEQLNID